MAATLLLPTRTVAFALLLAATAASAKEPADIPVVKTWGELMDVEPLDVKGQKVRVGIEADTFAVTGGVLLYCLVDESLDGGVGGGIDYAGPVRVRVQWPNGERTPRVAEPLQVLLKPKPAAPCLYVKPLTSMNGGRLVVSVLPPADRAGDGDQQDAPVLAVREVRVADEPYHGWKRLERVASDDPAAPPPGGASGRDEPPVYPMRACEGAWAPHREGYRPFQFEQTVGGKRTRRQRGDPLPTLFPDRPDPRLRLSGDGTSLTLESEAPFAGAFPERRLLARWWVNDEPVIPRPARRAEMMRAEQVTGQPDRPTKLRLRMEWDPDDVGARSGDRVRIQLLHSPVSAQPVGGQLLHAHQVLSQQGEEDYVSRMSNTIEFDAP